MQRRNGQAADTNITNEGMRHLQQLEGLERLNLMGTAVSDEAVERLKGRLPHCEIISGCN